MTTKSPICLNPFSKSYNPAPLVEISAPLPTMLEAWERFKANPANDVPPFTGKKDGTPKDREIFALLDSLFPELYMVAKDEEKRKMALTVTKAVYAVKQQACTTARKLKQLLTDEGHNFHDFFAQVFVQLEAHYTRVTNSKIKKLTKKLTAAEAENALPLHPSEWHTGREKLKQKIATLEQSLQSEYAELLGPTFVEAYTTYKQMLKVYNIEFEKDWSTERVEKTILFNLSAIDPSLTPGKPPQLLRGGYFEVFTDDALPNTTHDVASVKKFIESVDTMLKIAQIAPLE
jgi:hypothetical protein